MNNFLQYLKIHQISNNSIQNNHKTQHINYNHQIQESLAQISHIFNPAELFNIRPLLFHKIKQVHLKQIIILMDQWLLIQEVQESIEYILHLRKDSRRYNHLSLLIFSIHFLVDKDHKLKRSWEVVQLAIFQIVIKSMRYCSQV